MLAGNNGILNRAGEARDKTKEMQKDEEVKMAVLGSYDSYANLNIDMLLENLNRIKDITVTTTQDNGKEIFPVIVETEYTTYEITDNGNFEEVVIADRTGISVGDYITYKSPVAKMENPSVSLSTTETGYISEQTLPAKDIFRVLDIDKYGNMTLIGAMTPSDKNIIFSGAKGYNNAVYTLNKKCSDLYKDTDKGIIARSIKIEDITEKFNQTGIDKLTADVNNKISSLSLDKNVTRNKTENGEFDNTIKYRNGRTSYPDIFQYEAGGSINSTYTTGEVSQSEVYRQYNYNGNQGLTDLTNKKATTSLTVSYTEYGISPVERDFKDSSRALAYRNIFFETDTRYWLASRSISSYSSYAIFNMRGVNKSKFNGSGLYGSNGDNYNSGDYRVCPIVYIPSSVEITVSTDKSTYHKTEPHIIQ